MVARLLLLFDRARRTGSVSSLRTRSAGLVPGSLRHSHYHFYQPPQLASLPSLLDVVVPITPSALMLLLYPSLTLFSGTSETS